MKSIMRNNTLQNLLYIFGGLAGISLIILIHEAGHFLFAQLFNVPTPYFSIGFGPTLVAFQVGKTVFNIALLPFGGYVEMDPIAFAQLTYFPQMLILFAGILFNLIFAYAILIFYALRNQSVFTATISKITPDSPADKAGLQSGDIIITCNNQPIDGHAERITSLVAASAQQTIPLTIERNGNNQEIVVTLDSDHPLFGSNTGWLGIELKTKPISRISLPTALHKGHTQFTSTTQEMGNAVSKIITSKNKQNMIMGPIGIISMIGKSLAINPQLYWFILAILSLNMGLFNILPLPFFDGGKALIITIEAVLGITIPATILWLISTVFLALFVLFITRVSLNDIKRLINK